MNRSLLDTSRQLLAVSQFTLYADTKKGRRPSFIDAMAPDEVRECTSHSARSAARQG